MARPMLRLVQAGFAGGLNTTADDLAVQPNEARTLENTRVDEYGNASKRLGTLRLHTTALSGAVTGGIEWQGQQYIASNGELRRATLTTAMTFTTVGAGLSSAQPTRFVPFQRDGGEVLFVADGGRLLYTNGTTLTRVSTGPTSVSRVWVYNQRLYSVQGDFVYWSAINRGDTLGNPADGGGFAPVRTFTDGNLTAGATLKGSLLLFHKSGISRFTGLGQDDIAIAAGLVGVTGDVGTTAPDSVISLEDIALFLSDRGFYLATETGVQPIGTQIERTLEGLDRLLWDRVLAVHNRRQREVWFYLPGLGVYVYQYRLRAWFGPWTVGYIAPEPRAMWEATGTDGRPVVLIGDASGWVRQADAIGVHVDNRSSGQSDGVAFPMRITTPRLFGSDIALEKSLRQINVVTNLRSAARLLVTAKTRTGTDTQALTSQSRRWGLSTPSAPNRWGVGRWGGESLRTRQVNPGGRSEYVEVTLECDSADGSPTVARIECMAFAMGYRGTN